MTSENFFWMFICFKINISFLVCLRSTRSLRMNDTDIGTFSFDVFLAATSTPVLALKSVLLVMASVGAVVEKSLVILSSRSMRSAIHMHACCERVQT